MTDATRNERMIVLLDAIEHFYANVTVEDERERREFEKAERWFANRDVNDPASFEAICKHLGIDPERIRRALARRRGQVGPRA